MTEKPNAQVKVFVHPGPSGNNDRYTLVYHLTEEGLEKLPLEYRATIHDNHGSVSDIRPGGKPGTLMVILKPEKVTDTAKAQRVAINIATTIGVQIGNLSVEQLGASGGDPADDPFAALDEHLEKLAKKFDAFLDEAGEQVNRFVTAAGKKIEELGQNIQGANSKSDD